MERDRYQDTAFARARSTGGAHGYVAYFPKPIPRQVPISESNGKVTGLYEGSSSMPCG
jgi:hypothetical protein